MSTQRRNIILSATEKAMELRQSAGIKLFEPVDVYELAEQLGVEVRFMDFPSMEGMYVKGSPPVIVVSALRPAGRQVYTCAHELGHHVFGHGTRSDELFDERTVPPDRWPEEFLVDCFAGMLLMPKSAVSGAFARRRWEPQRCTPLQVYTIAGWFGVGYTTLLKHMSSTLQLMPQAYAAELRKVQPKRIRSEFLGADCKGSLTIVDQYWMSRSIDIQVGDLISVPAGMTCTGENIRIQQQCENRMLFVGTKQGIGLLENQQTGWSGSVRVSREQYIGRSGFRYLEDEDDDE